MKQDAICWNEGPLVCLVERVLEVVMKDTFEKSWWSPTFLRPHPPHHGRDPDRFPRQVVQEVGRGFGYVSWAS